MLSLDPTAIVVISVVASTLIGLFVSVPLGGALTRLRANYTPKGIKLDEEEDGEVVVPRTGPPVEGYFAMLFRAKRLEGWAGLYKGSMPTFIIGFLSIAASTAAIFAIGLPSKEDPMFGKSYGPLKDWGFTIAVVLVTLPIDILTARAVTTPYRLPWFQPKRALRVLFTPSERRRPWLIYFTPGLLVSEFLNATIIVLGLHGLRHFVLPMLKSPDRPPFKELPTFRLVMYIDLVILGGLILCPIQVIATRLLVQRNHSATLVETATEDAEREAVGLTVFSPEEEVIGLRDEKDPYTSFLDCGKRIANEEGWRVLFRGWWITLIGAVIGALA